MGLESVIEEILARGKAEAEEIRKAAQADREQMLQEVRLDSAKLLAEREQAAHLAADRMRVQDLARAELESKRIVLAGQKDLLDEVHAKVLERLAVWPECGALLRKMLDATASDWHGGQVHCGSRDADVVRGIVGGRFGGTIDTIGGFVIESEDGSQKTDLRFESLLSDVWRDSIRKVAEVLWPSK